MIFNDCTPEASAIASDGRFLAFSVSLGRDTAVMLDMMSRITDFSKARFFHWSYYPVMLPYHARYLSMIEKRYGIKVDVFTRPDQLEGQAEFRDAYLKQYSCGLCLMGCRMDESLQRRGMLKSLENGTDEKRHYAYPLRSMTQKTEKAYLFRHKIPLQPEYALGLRHDMQEHRGDRSWILRHCISEADYQAAIRQDINVEIDYARTEFECRADALAEIQREEDEKERSEGLPLESETDK